MSGVSGVSVGGPSCGAHVVFVTDSWILEQQGMPSQIVAVHAVLANTILSTLEAQAKALAVLFQALALFASAAAHRLRRAVGRRANLLVNCQARAFERPLVVAPDSSHSHHALCLVQAIVVAGGADAAAVAAHVIAEARAILLQTPRAATSAALLFRTSQPVPRFQIWGVPRFQIWGHSAYASRCWRRRISQVNHVKTTPADICRARGMGSRRQKRVCVVVCVVVCVRREKPAPHFRRVCLGTKHVEITAA